MRIVHRIIGTNVVLKEKGVVQSYNCNFCDNEKDTIEHIFWRCKFVCEFWKTLEKLMKEKCPNTEYLYFTENIALFGTDLNLKTDTIFDLIILLAKNYIYRCKITKQQILIPVFIKMLKTRYEMEKYIAIVNLELQKFEMNWINYKTLVEESQE